MKTKTLRITLFLALASMFWGCYPYYGAEDIDEYDLVYTNHTKDYNFKGKPNYAMPDKIVMINGELQTGGTPEFMNQTYANQIFSRIRANMSALGYSEVTDTTKADFFILPGALKVTNVSYSYWGDYYGWYYGYGYYYPYPVVTSYTTGTVMINLVERNLSPDNRRMVPWIALINGLLEGSSTDYMTRINKTVDQAFTQSDYLHQ